MIAFDALVTAVTTIGFPAAIALYFIWFVLTQISKKQDRFIENQDKHTAILQDMLNAMNSTKDEVQELQDRVENVEKALSIEHQSRRRKSKEQPSTTSATA